jgi:hypothetical protein
MSNKQNNIELGVSTPKAPVVKPPPCKETRESQFDEDDAKAAALAMGLTLGKDGKWYKPGEGPKGGGKGKKGKKGKGRRGSEYSAGGTKKGKKGEGSGASGGRFGGGLMKFEKEATCSNACTPKWAYCAQPCYRSSMSCTTRSTGTCCARSCSPCGSRPQTCYSRPRSCYPC